ncbi:hypothetical protein TNCV_1708401 [Trichonephila clavipes]|nr:hypothetical protein TNCV_1708401 [Trichonephila clavipes]
MLEIIGDWSGNVLCSPIKAVSVLVTVIQWRNGEYKGPPVNGYGHDMSRVRVPATLKMHRVEELRHVKSVMDQCIPVTWCGNVETSATSGVVLIT